MKLCHRLMFSYESVPHICHDLISSHPRLVISVSLRNLSLSDKCGSTRPTRPCVITLARSAVHQHELFQQPVGLFPLRISEQLTALDALAHDLKDTHSTERTNSNDGKPLVLIQISGARRRREKTFIESTRCSIASPVTHHVLRLPTLNARCIRGFRQQLLCGQVKGEEGRGEIVWAVGHQASLWPSMGAFSVLVQYHA